MTKSKDQNKKVQDFKNYLTKGNPLTGRLYFGNIDHEIDAGFESAIKLLENKISKAINRSISGYLWKSSGFNYDASIDDVNNSINLIIKAQATLDSLGPYTDHQEIDKPQAFNFSNTPPGYLEESDPDQSQRQGVTQQNLPEDILELLDLSQDDRVLELVKLLNSKKNEKK